LLLPHLVKINKGELKLKASSCMSIVKPILLLIKLWKKWDLRPNNKKNGSKLEPNLNLWKFKPNNRNHNK
jgi:hypothetical protein